MNNTITMIMECIVVSTLVIAILALGQYAGYPGIGFVMSVLTMLACLGPDDRQ